MTTNINTDYLMAMKVKRNRCDALEKKYKELVEIIERNKHTLNIGDYLKYKRIVK